MAKYKIVLLVGSGNLGSRYLQGISHCSTKISVFIIDKNLKSLQKARERLHEFKNFNHNKTYEFKQNLRKIPKKIDLVIISTCADVRPKIIKELVKKYHIKNWILEKILAQSETKLIGIRKKLKSDKRIYINIPITINRWYHQIRKKIGKIEKIKIKIYGEKNLASNSIHHIHFLNWLTKEKIVKIVTAKLKKNWHKAKRKNFWDIQGQLKVLFSNGSILEINSPKKIYKGQIEKNSKILIKIQNKNQKWLIDETRGIAIRKKNKNFKSICLRGKIELQSRTTTNLVDKILSKKNCKLPKLNNSIDLHIQLIKYLKLHWNRNMKKKIKLLPIT